MLLVGLVVLAARLCLAAWGRRWRIRCRRSWTRAGAPLRNVHKLEPVVRIPIVLGLAHLLSRVPLPGSVPRPVWIAGVRPPRGRQAGGGGDRGAGRAGRRHVAGVDGPAHPAGRLHRRSRSTGTRPPTGSTEHNTGSPTPGRVLVVPGAPFATQVWGNSHDEPLQVLGDSPWGVRDSIPLTPPQTIRALDSVQRLLAAGRPSAGLADTLVRQGISYVVVRNDLDPETSRSARPILVHRAIDGSPGLTKVAQFGDPVGPGTLDGFITDSGLRPLYPAVEIYRVDGAGNPGAPYLADATRMARVDGGPEVLLRLDERRRLLGQPPLGPVLLTQDARAAGVPLPPGVGVTVTDTPVARETDYGRVDDHSSAIRAEDDGRHTFNRVPDYPAPGAHPVYGGWNGGRLSTSSSSADATALPNVAPASGAAAAIDGDSATSWVSNALQAAVGQWLQVDFDHPVTNATLTLTPALSTIGAQVRQARGRHRQRHHHAAGRPARQAADRGAALRRDAVGAHHGRGDGERLLRCPVRHHRPGDHPVRRQRLCAPGQPSPHRAGAGPAAGRAGRDVGPGLGHVGPTGLHRGPLTACTAPRRCRWRPKSWST